MQKYSKLLIVLPCHSMEDFPTHHRGGDAANLLANWTALWHPALIACCGSKPDWQKADSPDLGLDETEDNYCLAVIPAVAESILDPELLVNLEKNDSLVISDLSTRAEIVRLAIEGSPAATSLAEKVDPEIAGDFLALGYAFLQVQLMTRQLRYSSNLDETLFSQAVVKAANAATDGDSENARKGLTRCFDLLLEEKNSYYPVEPELIDVVLTATTTLGAALKRQLNRSHSLNLLLTGSVVDQIFTKQPETAVRLKQMVADQEITLVGGLGDELPDSLMSTESTIHQLQIGREIFRRHFGVDPTVFMRRRFGLTSSLPGLLDQFNFVGAIHATLDDGKFPAGSNCNIRWTGEDDRSVLAIGDVPLAANDSGSFIGLGVRLGEAIDSAHIAAAVFVHWPDDTCDSFHDLLRITSYGPLFGDFVGLNDYFDSVYDPGYGDTFSADEYKTPYLKQAITKESLNPVSSVTKYWQRFYELSACRSLLTQVCAKTGLAASAAKEIQMRINTLQTSIETALNVQTDVPAIDDQIENLKNELSTAWTGSLSDRDQAKTPAAIELVNPTSFGRRVELKTASNNTGTLKQNPPVLICDATKSGAHWLLDVPAMGAVQVDLDSPGTKDLLKSDPEVGEGWLLRNEYFELQVDEGTGGIRGIQLYKDRINLVSQQLAMRIPAAGGTNQQPLTKARYSRMVADDIQLKQETRLACSIVSKGRLLDDEHVVAEFEQSVRVVRGRRIIEFEVEVCPTKPLTNNLNHYVCSRLAWKSESSRIVANSQESRHEVNSDWFLATNFFEVVQDQHRLTMLTGGLPYHRRSSRRTTDSLLVVGNEQSRRFRFGLGINVPYAMAAAVDRMTKTISTSMPAVSGGENTSHWLFHFDCKNILVTWWEPFFDDHARWAGVRIRLRETEGRKGKLGINCPRPIASAEQVNFGGDFLQSLEVAESDPSRVLLEFGRFDYFQISIHWKL